MSLIGYLLGWPFDLPSNSQHSYPQPTYQQPFLKTTINIETSFKTNNHMDLSKQSVKNRPKQEIVNEIKSTVEKLNKLTHEAGVINLSVRIFQGFNPLSNANGAPLNAPVSAIISETTNY